MQLPHRAHHHGEAQADAFSQHYPQEDPLAHIQLLHKVIPADCERVMLPT